MDNKKYFAVITGDVAGSSRLEGDQRRKLLDELHKSFEAVAEILGNNTVAFQFEVFRGDSFQGVMAVPHLAFKAGLIIRTCIRKAFRTTLKDAFDARIAIGIGTIDLMPNQHGGEGDGEAYRNSGPYLDNMNKTKGFLSITTPRDEVNRELLVECALLDAIISRWTPAQAEAIFEYFKGKTQDEMAESFNISQPGIRKRLLSANLPAIEMMDNRFIELIENETNNYNPVG